MKAADGTIKFAKDWIEGRLNKRQYMHYYVVKTDHTEFMMKANDNPEVVAIRDHLENVFIIDDAMLNNHPSDERAIRNPFFALLEQGYKFRYFLITEETFPSDSPISRDLSTWKTLDWQLIVSETHANLNIHMALVEIGGQRYLTAHYPMNDEERIKTISLRQWLAFTDVSGMKWGNTTTKYSVQPYCTLTQTKSKENSILKVRGSFADFAGPFAEKTKVSHKYMYIPTTYDRLDKLIGMPTFEAHRTRPNPLQFGVPTALINFNHLDSKALPFDPKEYDPYTKGFLNVSGIPDGRNIQYTEDWKTFLLKKLDGEVAENLIAFIEADDAWLREHGDKTRLFVDGNFVKEHVLRDNLSGYCLLMEEENPSILDTHVIYVKGILCNDYDKKIVGRYLTFTKLMPIPCSSRNSQINEVINHVSESE